MTKKRSTAPAPDSPSPLTELLLGSDRLTVPSCDDWPERFGIEAPTTLDGWRTLAIRCEIDPNEILKGSLTLRETVAIAEGKLAGSITSTTPTKRTRRRRPRNNTEAKARRAERDRKAKADRKLWDAWRTGQYRTYADLAKTQNGMSATDVCRVIKRVGKRIARHGFA